MPNPVQSFAQQENSSPVAFTRLEVLQRLRSWRLIRAAIDGEWAVKNLREEALPYPQVPLTSEDKLAESRYHSYLLRAVWYNVSARTLEGMTGYVFANDPTIDVPDVMQPLVDNANGAGVSLLQQAKSALRTVLAFGRCGLLVDYPTVALTDAATSRQQLLDGSVSATINLYQPEQIINWRVSFEGAKQKLTMLVLMEGYFEPSSEDEFQLIQLLQFRALTLQADGTVLGRVFQLDAEKKDYVENHELKYEPKDSNGQPLREIPFSFIGSVDNDANVDNSPLEDLVTLNYAHYRNSADYEESCFITGQPTPWISGLTDQWVKEVLKGQIQLGSRAVIPLPVGGAAGLLQAQANSMPYEAMVAKEAQMVALGAKLVETKTVQRTATEAGLDQASEVSILSSAAQNVFLAYKSALSWACLFTGADDATIEFKLSEPLTHDAITPQQGQTLMALYQGGLIDWEEVRAALKKAGVAWKDDDEVKENVQAELPPPALTAAAAPGATPPPAAKGGGAVADL